MQSHRQESVGPASFDQNIISPVTQLGEILWLTSSLKCVRSFPEGISSSAVIRCRYGFSVFLNASPVGFYTADTTVWAQIWCRNNPSLIFGFLVRNHEVNLEAKKTILVCAPGELLSLDHIQHFFFFLSIRTYAPNVVICV